MDFRVSLTRSVSVHTTMPSVATVLQAMVGRGCLLDVHHAEPALSGDGQPGVIAVVGHLGAHRSRGLDEVGAGRDLDGLVVDRELGHYFATSASNSSRNFSM